MYLAPEVLVVVVGTIAKTGEEAPSTFVFWESASLRVSIMSEMCGALKIANECKTTPSICQAEEASFG